jgi:hypothetical protein
MRAFLAVALSSLALVAAGCGGGGSTGVASGATLGTDAAQLVPADAVAFVSADTNLDSAQWQRVDDLTQSFPARAKLLDDIRSELQKRGLTWKDDVAPALGDELDVAAFGSGDNLEYVAFAKPDDVAKLRTLAEKVSTGTEKYTVEQIGGWSVVADSQELFDKVRAAQGGTSLADSAKFNAAWSSVSGDALARVYVDGKLASKQLKQKSDWYAARVAADGDALRLNVLRHPVTTVAVKKHALLADVPSGAALAVAFHGSADLLPQLASTKLGAQLPLKQLAPLLNGDGVLYLKPSGLLPLVAVELTPKNPQAALVSARALVRNLTGKLGPVPLTAQLVNGKVVISDGPAAANALRSGPKLVDDSTYKDAIKAAGAPSQTTLLAYADATELAPIVQLLGQLLGGKGAADQSLGTNLEHVGTVVAWGSKASGNSDLHVWVQPR